ncbi:MAG: class B sortase [Lachnospiraceae bacterium]|nr:class B sortase [Lachnospiraceae bacterium]
MKNKRRLILLFIRTALLLIVIVCLFKMGQTYYLSVKHEKELANLRNILRTAESAVKWGELNGQEYKAETISDALSSEITTDILEQEPEIMEKFKSLYAENNELIGWLSIPETTIDYPVMQNEDNEYYLHHNFYGEEDKYGCLFVKGFVDVNTPGTNFIIYGHNMKDGSMFGELDEYKDESFCREHPLIYFDTLYEEQTYEVIAVFLSRVYESDDDVFKYYEFYQADTEDEFLSFYNAVKDMSLYETEVTAEFGDTFLMLSTCAYHVDDGRLVVLAKKIS